MLDDLDAASNRVRRKSHRVRTLVLMLAGVVGAAFAFSKSRPWLTKRTENFGAGTSSRGRGWAERQKLFQHLHSAGCGEP